MLNMPKTNTVRLLENTSANKKSNNSFQNNLSTIITQNKTLNNSSHKIKISNIVQSFQNKIKNSLLKKSKQTSLCTSSDNIQCDYLGTEPTPSSTANTTNYLYTEKTNKQLKNSWKSIDLSYDSVDISYNDLFDSNDVISIEQLTTQYPSYSKAKYSKEQFGSIKAYGVNTYQGILKKSNEDRIAIAFNITRPKSYVKEIWPNCSIFCIFDGHCGYQCADYLKDNMIRYIIQNKYFPNEPIKALQYGYKKAEDEYYQQTTISNGESGSCALVALIFDDKVYVANVGDSKAMISMRGGNDYTILSKDHKPDDPEEKQRIEFNGGKVYQEKISLNQYITSKDSISNELYLLGPSRIIPGYLSVSRTIGDYSIKQENSEMIIATPSIEVYSIDKKCEYLIMGSDGVFERMSHSDIIQCVSLCKDCGDSADLILKTAMKRNAIDNLSVIVIQFRDI